MATAGSAYDFDGTSGTSYINMGSFSSLDGATEMTMIFWINYNSFANEGAAVGQYDSFSSSSWYHSSENDAFNLTVKEAGTTAFRVVESDDALGTLFSFGTWAHTAFNWKQNNDDITDFNFYLDGVSKSISIAASAGNPSALASGSYDLELGALNSNALNLDGKIAYICLYDRQLSADEIKETIYNPFSFPDNICKLFK